MSKLLLIGMAPARTGDPAKVLQGRTGLWLADLMGLPLDEYLRRTDRRNLFDRWPGKSGKGDAWDAQEARIRAGILMPDVLGRRVLFVGRAVAAAFAMPRVPLLTWVGACGAWVAVVPHPSGIVRWWNSEENRARAGEFLRLAVVGEEQESAR